MTVKLEQKREAIVIRIMHCINRIMHSSGRPVVFVRFVRGRSG